MNVRRALFFSALVALSCSTNRGSGPEPPGPDLATLPLTLEQEAMVLELEDRRAYDSEIARQWSEHPSPWFRQRIAVALGRIGTATFIDSDGDGVRDAGERAAGAEELERLSLDPVARVAEAALFALGEIEAIESAPLLARIASDTEANGAVRAAAIEALTKLGPDAVSVDLWEELMSPAHPPGIRVPAIRYAFRLGEEAFAAAGEHLDDPDDEVRSAAAYAHSRRANEASRDALVELLEDEDALIRSLAVRAIDRLGDHGDLDLFHDLIRDAHPWVRVNAVRGIQSLLSADPTLGDAALAVALLGASRDPDPGTRALAIEALAPLASSHPPVRARLEELLSAPEWWFREQAALALARADLLDSASLTTRGMKLTVARGLGQGLSSELRNTLLGDENPSVRVAALYSIPDERIVDYASMLEGLLEDEDPMIRGAALERLGSAGATPEMVERTRMLERTWRADVLNDSRLSAISFLAEHDEEQRETLLHDLLDDPDPVVRRRAADLIESELGRPRPQFTPLPVRHRRGDYMRIAEWARGEHTASIRTVRGTIDIVLLTQDAPMTAWNFARLADEGYYDETSFMRVVPNFVIQGGDPRLDMTGGPGWAIRDEINDQHYTRGAVGMALSGPDTGGSQFFITHSPQYHLDGGYTIFGRVIDGMNGAVDQMHRDDTVITIEIDTIEPDPASVESSARSPLPLRIGRMERAQLESEVPEYQLRTGAYEPDLDVLAMMSTLLTPDHSVTVVLGTWCRDSQREVPRFFSIVDSLKRDFGVELDTRYVAVDRPKVEPEDLVGSLGVTNVATFIVYEGDRELGRVVETPRSLLEDDLLAILAGAYQ